MQILMKVALWLFVFWCALETSISVRIIATWDQPYHSEKLNQAHRAMKRSAHRSLKFMHARHALGWLAAGAATAYLAL